MARELDLHCIAKPNHFSDVQKSHAYKDSINDPDKDLLTSQFDLNQDDKTNIKDYGLLFDYIYKNEDNSITLTDAQKKLADIDNNGTINCLDLYKAGRLIGQNVYNSINPNETLKGDLNNDGKVNKDDVSAFVELNYTVLGLVTDRTPTKHMIQAADFNGDGILNGYDLEELESLMTKKTASKETNSLIKSPITDKLLGDLNFDGSVDYDDLEILGKSFNSYKKQDKLTEEQKAVADMNKDGKVDFSDMMFLRQNISDGLLKSIQPGSSLRGDLNNDGNVDKKDEWAFVIASDIVRNHPEESLNGLSQILDLNNDGKINKKDYNILHYDLLKNKRPVIPSPTKTDPANWMVSQRQGPTNLNEDKPFLNGNCGVASLLMVARMFGKIGGAAEEANEQIQLMRELMGGINSEYEGSTSIETADGARSLGLSAKVTHSNINDIVRALKHGKKVIAGVDPKNYAPTTTSTRHSIVISGFDGEKFTVYDPAFQKPIKLTKQQLGLALLDVNDNTVIIGM